MIYHPPMRLFRSSLLLAALAGLPARAQTRPDSARPRTPPDTTAPKQRAPFWPDSVRGPTARAGAILPFKRIIAFYGNPLSKRMGILGELPPKQMMAKLEDVVRTWEKADTTVGVQPALELITTVAQAGPGRDGLYRQRMADTVIEQVYGWAHSHGWLLILDVQVGRSTVAAELDPLRKFLMRPDVHLAIDPEFDVSDKQRPGAVIGTTDAVDINYASNLLCELVDQFQLPPKVLIVHRFTKPMVTHASAIQLDARVQVVMHMDGFGEPGTKRESLRAYIEKEPVQWVGFKLFYKNDHPMLTPKEVLQLHPIPLFISYQ